MLDIWETCFQDFLVVIRVAICFLLTLLQIIKEVGFEGGFKEFLEMLRTEKRFYYDTKVSFCLPS